MANAFIFLIGISLGSMGGILMKIGANQIGKVDINSFGEMLSFLLKLFTNFPSLVGVCLYFLSAVIWFYLLTKLDISFVQPILALTYVITPLFAIVFLNENISLLRWVGIIVIILGVIIVARSAS